MTTKPNYKPCEGCNLPARLDAVETELQKIKADLRDIQSHDRRQDALLMDLQLEIRQGNKAILDVLATLVSLVKKK